MHFNEVKLDQQGSHHSFIAAWVSCMSLSSGQGHVEKKHGGGRTHKLLKESDVIISQLLDGVTIWRLTSQFN